MACLKMEIAFLEEMWKPHQEPVAPFCRMPSQFLGCSTLPFDSSTLSGLMHSLTLLRAWILSLGAPEAE